MQKNKAFLSSKYDMLSSTQSPKALGHHRRAAEGGGGAEIFPPLVEGEQAAIIISDVQQGIELMESPIKLKDVKLLSALCLGNQHATEEATRLGRILIELAS